MKLSLEINRKVTCPISDKYFSEIAKKTIELSGYRFLPFQKISLSLAIIGDGEMKKINRQFRKKDCATDVLSFANFSGEQLKKEKSKDIFLGEILISFPYLKKSAKIRSIEIKNEVKYITSHGILHCLGFKHGKEMFTIQEMVVATIKN